VKAVESVKVRQRVFLRDKQQQVGGRQSHDQTYMRRGSNCRGNIDRPGLIRSSLGWAATGWEAVAPSSPGAVHAVAIGVPCSAYVRNDCNVPCVNVTLCRVAEDG